jgi:hypothetical protein
MIEEPASLEQYHRVTLRLGARTVTIDTAPLPRWGIYMILTRPREGCLVIRRSRRSWLLGLAGVALLAVVCGLAVAGHLKAIDLLHAYPLLIACPLVFLILLLNRPWTSFDLDSYYLEQANGVFGARRRFPLTELQCLQLLRVERPPPLHGPAEIRYQLNAVLENHEHPRLNLIESEDAAWARKAGDQIAEFVQTSLVAHGFE